jgi:hypothetical protein
MPYLIFTQMLTSSSFTQFADEVNQGLDLA